MGLVAVKASTERIPGPEPAGRICADPECTTPLSTYNSGTECSVHGGWPQYLRTQQVEGDRADVLQEAMAA